MKGCLFCQNMIFDVGEWSIDVTSLGEWLLLGCLVGWWHCHCKLPHIVEWVGCLGIPESLISINLCRSSWKLIFSDFNQKWNVYKYFCSTPHYKISQIHLFCSWVTYTRQTNIAKLIGVFFSFVVNVSLTNLG